jgi:hypothetical protein
VLVKVAGILQDPPPNTDFPIKVVISFHAYGCQYDRQDPNDWILDQWGHELLCVAEAGQFRGGAGKIHRSDWRGRTSRRNSKSGAGLQALGDMHYDTTLDVYSGNLQPEIDRGPGPDRRLPGRDRLHQFHQPGYGTGG